MTTAQIIFSIYIYSMLLVYIIALPKIFKKAGYNEGWKAYLPGYNLFIWLKVIQQPWWWMFFFIPYFTSNSIGMLLEGVAFLMMISMNVSTGRIFRKFSWQDTLKMVFLPQWGIWEVATDDSTYFGKTDWHDEEQVEERKTSDWLTLFLSLPVIGVGLVYLMQVLGQKKKKSGKSLAKEWTDAILFAIVAASIIRSFVFEPFTIPTPSMEKDLLVGDYLFVSKLSYGPKLPNTPLSIPFFHNYIPVVGGNSYVEWAKRPYRRLPGVGSVERNEVFVFNFPAGDTAIYDPGVEGLMGHNYYEQLRGRAFKLWTTRNDLRIYGKIPEIEEVDKYNSAVRQNLENEYGLIHRPVDKRENYIKRCVAVAGDVIEIIDGVVHINGKPGEVFEDMQYVYEMTVPGMTEGTLDMLKEDFDVMRRDIRPNPLKENTIVLPLRPKDVEAVEKRLKTKLTLNFKTKGAYTDFSRLPEMTGYLPIFPNHQDFDWTEDNFGPLKIPAKGMTIELSKENWILYKRSIEVFEGNQVEEKDGKYFINGSEASQYTFKMDYYWAMGDNRHMSADSRFWGFVPEDHVVGKAIFIWMSIDPDHGMFGGGVRWNRIFTSID